MSQPPRRRYDPVYLHARREGILILLVWAGCMAWTVPYCYLFGYDNDPETIRITLGMPSWVLWGVAVPWLAATVFSCWFALCYMKDDPLDGESGAEEGQPARPSAGEEGPGGA